MYNIFYYYKDKKGKLVQKEKRINNLKSLNEKIKRLEEKSGKFIIYNFNQDILKGEKNE